MQVSNSAQDEKFREPFIVLDALGEYEGFAASLMLS